MELSADAHVFDVIPRVPRLVYLNAGAGHQIPEIALGRQREHVVRGARDEIVCVILGEDALGYGFLEGRLIRERAGQADEPELDAEQLLDHDVAPEDRVVDDVSRRFLDSELILGPPRAAGS